MVNNMGCAVHDPRVRPCVFVFVVTAARVTCGNTADRPSNRVTNPRTSRSVVRLENEFVAVSLRLSRMHTLHKLLLIKVSFHLVHTATTPEEKSDADSDSNAGTNQNCQASFADSFTSLSLLGTSRQGE